MKQEKSLQRGFLFERTKISFFLIKHKRLFVEVVCTLGTEIVPHI